MIYCKLQNRSIGRNVSSYTLFISLALENANIPWVLKNIIMMTSFLFYNGNIFTLQNFAW